MYPPLLGLLVTVTSAAQPLLLVADVDAIVGELERWVGGRTQAGRLSAASGET